MLTAKPATLEHSPWTKRYVRPPYVTAAVAGPQNVRAGEPETVVVPALHRTAAGAAFAAAE
jgi:hypothetical protein